MFSLYLLMKVFKQTGEHPDRIKVYIMTHTRKNGAPVDDAAAEAIVGVI